MKTFILHIICLGLFHQVIGQTESTTIAFGSCSREDKTDQMWSEIIAENPDLFIWTGDIVYGDTHDMKTLKTKYDLQKSRDGYQKLLKQMPVIGIWDDHDYGVNDGGKYYTMKKQSKEVLLDFLDVPKSDPVFDHEGAYSTYTLGESDRRIKVILLDCRYFRDTLEHGIKNGPRYKANLNGDILGEEQWLWLEKELRSSSAAINMVVSGIQVLSAEHHYEKWDNFPKARKRLLDLIEDIQPAPTLFLTGDRHIAELSKFTSDKLDYPLFDFTASGLTHTWSEPWEERNPSRVGDLIIQKNFGIIEVNWSENKPKVTFVVKGHERAEFMRYEHQY
ncbi:alkaline phosphatase family protein [Fulvivirga sp. M361]|uniref:alkaline phosphatase D family protein n=1 Tax=Fulvivirga sp. M361 TaxID=2594266 RepID=UPI00117AF1FD|nr:alkaline phosphatase D family protein [Fulvivirga sp. M361]TRX55939.1 alkaline phosphatase family protein [Fulvivirga sp. M361]